ncbi:MAG: pyridoxamine 5'-phosphate oxidase family protein [Anaerolineaceae bacterium]|nr:pyridoxamine 5'-phosphate oxidase family protein [Anaerolineaceae bacterium]
MNTHLIENYPGLMEALAGEMIPKFLATRSGDGIPNIVPCTSLTSAGDVDDRLIFGNFLLRKSVDNLNQNPYVGIMVITPALEGWILQGNFMEWQQTGTYVDYLNNSDLLRYNAYTGIRNAGVIQIQKVIRHFRISKQRVLIDYLLARAATCSKAKGSSGEAVVMPPVVRRNFSLMMAVRMLAFLDGDGYPLVTPTLSLQPTGENTLVCAQGMFADILELLDSGSPVAASLLTFDAVSFQTKGCWLGSRNLMGAPVGTMSVTSVYAGGPPIPGRRVA